MRKILRFLIWTALILGALVGILRLTAIRWWRLPSNDPYLAASVEPSLRGGDLILLWRFTKPKFGDLVLCPEPKHPERIVIARIAGEQGDNVKLSGSRVWVNGRAARTDQNCSERTFTSKDPATGVEVVQHCQMEELGGGAHLRGGVEGLANHPRDVVTDVPPNHLYLVSDNRLFPYDSREFGPIARESCTETVFYRLVSRGGFFDGKNRFTLIR
jgi:signal peptidase I